VSVAVEFEPAETWVLEGDLESLLEAVRFETDHIDVTEAGGEALLESTRAPGTYGHIAVLHRRASVEAPTGEVGETGDGEPPIRASFQHDFSPRTDSVKRALVPFRRETPEP